ncbi:MAG: Quinone oxidoreductase 1 [Paracidovorax wautersii]|uniref:Quinone oxidoreductase 1 n=1 Tax=Paracidovorax wautersii TaxID=1177982 RepID=A0A7V8FKP5_9BURK|nr:MAG: Quinone oxidoreductase 1 [Paracidovorax wautersii]
MAQVIKLAHTGAPEVLELTTVDQAEPGPKEAWIEQDAIGVNYLDVTQRQGAVPIALPSGLGLEGAGRVTAVGREVRNVAVGDRVAYALGPLGGYASGRLYPAERLVKLPDSLGFDDAAAVLFKGITAQYLIKSTYPVQAGTVVLLYGAAGPLGQILASWARYLGAFVIGVVSRAASVERARAAGCGEVLVWGAVDLPAEVARVTRGRKADVVYDGIGRLTFAASLDCLRPRGLMVSMGASTGVPAAVELGTLNAKGSLFLTRPGLAAHESQLDEYRERASDVFDAVSRGIIKPAIGRHFSLADAALAHASLERGAGAGTIVLKP